MYSNSFSRTKNNNHPGLSKTHSLFHRNRETNTIPSSTDEYSYYLDKTPFIPVYAHTRLFPNLHPKFILAKNMIECRWFDTMPPMHFIQSLVPFEFVFVHK